MINILFLEASTVFLAVVEKAGRSAYHDDFFEDIEIVAIDKILKYNTSELHDESNNTTRVTIDDRSTIDTS